MHPYWTDQLEIIFCSTFAVAFNSNILPRNWNDEFPSFFRILILDNYTFHLWFYGFFFFEITHLHIKLADVVTIDTPLIARNTQKNKENKISPATKSRREKAAHRTGLINKPGSGSPATAKEK